VAERGRERERVAPALRRMAPVWRTAVPACAALVTGLAVLGTAPLEAQRAGAAGAARTPPISPGARGYPVVAASLVPEEVLGSLSVDGDRLTARAAGRVLELREGSPFYRDGDRVWQLANPPYRDGGTFWIPAELLARLGPGGSAAQTVASAAGSDERGGDAAGAALPSHGPFRVVIDAGHGGKDPGARGPRGTLEKNIALAVAKKLEARLSKVPGIDASLTRRTDVFIPLAGRPRIAVERHADLFLSIHCNSEEGRSARGFETYFLSPSRTEESRRVAIRENSAIQYEDPKDRPNLDDINYILVANRQNLNVRESSFFAGEIQNEMRGDLSTPDRGVKQAGLYVLMGASGSMPAVLAEIGFISNPVEERFLRSSSGQAEIAAALADAVKEYASDYSQRLAAARTTATGGR
jgi:N-acetylmuramoyl-L-alanine amidase